MDERSVAMHESGRHAAAPPLAALLRWCATRLPHSVALAVHGGASMTYDSWDRRSNAAARGLVAHRVVAGDRVLLHFDNARWLDYAVAYAAVSKLGAVAVPMARRLCPPELRRVATDCRAVGTIAPPDLARPAPPPGWTASTTELERGQSREVLDPPEPPSDPEDILYCSGPMRPPRRLVVPAEPFPFDPGASPTTAMLHLFLVGTPAGQEALRLPLLHPGTVSVTFASFDPHRFCGAVAEQRAEVAGLPLFLAISLVESASAERHDLSSVRQVLVAPGPAPETVSSGVERLFSNAAVDSFGTAPAREQDDAGEGAPVTMIQASMLWQEQFAPGRFNLQPIVRRLAGRLDFDALRGALDELARRHEPLRTNFGLLGWDPVQVGPTRHGIELPVHDLSAVAAGDREASVKARIAEATNHRFDLVTGPVFEPELLKLGAEDHLLVIPLHHCTWDAASIRVLHRELSVLYADLVTAGPSSLPEPALRFSDFCRAEPRPGTERMESQLSYWRAQLRGAPLVTQLPIDDPDLPAGIPHPATDPVSIDLPPSLVAALRALARSEKATFFMVLLAAFQVLVHRYTDRDDLLVSSVVGRRDRRGVRDLIGFLANRVVLRLRLSGDPAFTDVLADVRGVVLGALANQDVPDDVLLEGVLGRDAWRHGLTARVMVLFQCAALPPPIELPGLTTTAMRSADMAAKRVHMTTAQVSAPAVWRGGLSNGTFLGLSVLEGSDEVAIVARGTFHRPTVERLLTRFELLLSGVVADPDRRVSELAVPTEAERTTSSRAEGVVGPAEDVLDLRGYRVRRSTVEGALRRCPGVGEVAVAVVDLVGYGPTMVAYVVPDEAGPPSLAQLRSFLWSEHPGYAWPAAMVVLDDLPRQSDRQVDPEALPVPRPGGEASEGRPHRTEECVLAAAWGHMLGIERVDIEEGYGLSFAFAEAVSLAYQSGMAVTGAQVLENRTVETLAAAIACAGEARPGWC